MYKGLRILCVFCLIVVCYLGTSNIMLFNPVYTALAASIFSLAAATPRNSSDITINYTTVTGYFLQDEPTTNASSFNFATTNFGLINQTYSPDAKNDTKKSQWQLFTAEVSRLQRQAPKNVHYKVLFMGRHGEGYHNAAESYFGTPAWNCYYSIINGNDTVTWADPDVTPLGVKQALDVNKLWAAKIETEKIPTPQSYYTSPLLRCLATAKLTFSGLKLPRQYPFIAIVKEFFREGISGHTCDRRRSKTWIQNSFPDYKIENGFTENDELYQNLRQETENDQDIRSRAALNDVFSQDRSTYISITSHSGEIASLLRGIDPPAPLSSKEPHTKLT